MDHKVAIITGASSGLGEATAVLLAKEGMRVALAARRKEELERVADRIRNEGAVRFPDMQPLVAPTDVRNREAIQNLVQAVIDRWGRVDILINNAGLGHSRRVANLDPEQLRQQVDVNLVAVIECSQAVLPAMLRQRSGNIVNISSIAGLIGLPNSSVYCATKFGVVGFTDALRREMRGTGVRVSLFCPGFIATDFSPRLRRFKHGLRRPPGVMTPEYAARRIYDLIQHPRRIDLVPVSWRPLVWLGRALPGLTDLLVHFFSPKE